MTLFLLYINHNISMCYFRVFTSTLQSEHHTRDRWCSLSLLLMLSMWIPTMEIRRLTSRKLVLGHTHHSTWSYRVLENKIHFWLATTYTFRIGRWVQSDYRTNQNFFANPIQRTPTPHPSPNLYHTYTTSPKPLPLPHLNPRSTIANLKHPWYQPQYVGYKSYYMV